jgi:hypothetical protein
MEEFLPMLRHRLVLTSLMGLAILGGGLTAARAGAGHDAAEIAALRNAKISLQEAIATAERTASGKAINAGLDNENGVMSYSVEVLKDSTVETVLVDLGSGQVRKVVPADSEAGEDSEQSGQETSD